MLKLSELAMAGLLDGVGPVRASDGHRQLLYIMLLSGQTYGKQVWGVSAGGAAGCGS